METDSGSHVMDIDQSGDCKSVMSLPVGHVQLWPLSDYLCVLAKWKFVNSMLQRDLNVEESTSLIDYLIHYTPVCPSELRLLQTVGEQNIQVCKMNG